MTCRCRSYNQSAPHESDPEVVLDVPDWAGSERETICVDACIAHVIRALWEARVWTLGCCCGHNGRFKRSVIVNRPDRERAAAIIRALGDDATILAWELVEGDAYPADREERDIQEAQALMGRLGTR